jgi:Flp pilus assembly pilin Flp
MMKNRSGIFSGLAFQNGQGLVEYGLLLVLVAIGIVLTMSLTGVSLSDLYCRVANGISGGSACKGVATYCQDTFDGNMSGWQNLQVPNPAPTVKNGQLCFSGAFQSFNKCSNQMPQSDYVINLNGITITQGNGYGVYFRDTVVGSKVNGYAFQYDPGAGNALLIRRWGNGSEIYPSLVQIPINAAVYNVPHDFKIVVKGSIFTVFMDGKQVMTATDSTYPTGGAGLRSWDSTSACLNDFSIGQVP